MRRTRHDLKQREWSGKNRQEEEEKLGGNMARRPSVAGSNI